MITVADLSATHTSHIHPDAAIRCLLHCPIVKTSKSDSAQRPHICAHSLRKKNLNVDRRGLKDVILESRCKVGSIFHSVVVTLSLSKQCT